MVPLLLDLAILISEQFNFLFKAVDNQRDLVEIVVDGSSQIAKPVGVFGLLNWVDGNAESFLVDFEQRLQFLNRGA